MGRLLLPLIEGVWILMGMCWLMAALRLKASVEREPALFRFVHLGVMGAAYFLLTNAYARTGILGRRFIGSRDWTGCLALTLTVAGGAFAVWARVYLGSNWSATITVKKGHELIRGGPYAMVRHPIYFGLLVAVLGTSLAVGEVRALVALAAALIGFLAKAHREERLMVKQFGNDYLRYARAVKCLVPFLL